MRPFFPVSVMSVFLLELQVLKVIPHGVGQSRSEQEHLILVPLVLQRQQEIILLVLLVPYGQPWNDHLIIDNMFQSQSSVGLNKTSNGSLVMWAFDGFVQADKYLNR